jgi:TRAP-type C4-dicarboxylate transport system substrate-binding protein
MKSKLFKTLCAAALALGLFTFSQAQTQAQTKLRMGTLAPRDTTFHKTIMDMGEAWKKASGGKVTLTVYTDGQMGSEADMVRRMRVGQLQAAMLTVGGLQAIEPEVGALQNMPLVFRDFDELDYISSKLEPELEKKFAEKGFVVLFWADAGWVRFFSKKPLLMPEDTKNLKRFVTAGDTATLDIVKSFGIKGIPLSVTDILTGLQTGLIDAVPTIPLYALTGQFDGTASHMTDINYAPLVGATVVTKKAWDAFTPEQQAQFREAADVAGDKIRARSRVEADESVQAMVKRGLTVHELSPAQKDAWSSFMEKNVYPVIRGKIVPAAKFDEVMKLLAEYRAKEKEAPKDVAKQ